MKERFDRELRAKVLELFGADIQTAQKSYSTSNYAFIFSEDFVIRVNIRREAHEDEYWMSELMFLSDAYESGASVCAPLKSLRARLLEQFDIDGIKCAAVKFAKAKGAVVSGKAINAEHARLAGDVLGRIHRVSRDAARSGKTYCRPGFIEADGFLLRLMDLQASAKWLTADVRQKMNGIANAVKALEAKPGENYGLIHADFTPYNYYADGESIWVFDFDDCHYGYYIYDIATLMLMWLTRVDANTELTSAQALDTLLPAFHEGYERHMTLEPEEWERLPLFMRYRQTISILDTIGSVETGEGKIAGAESGERILPPLIEEFAADDILSGIDRRMEGSRKRLQMITQILSGEVDLNAPENAYLKNLLESDDMKPFIKALLG